MRARQKKFLLLELAGIFIIAGCATGHTPQESALRVAKNSGDSKAYNYVIETFPDTPEAQEAGKFLADYRKKQILETGDIHAYAEYVLRNPGAADMQAAETFVAQQAEKNCSRADCSYFLEVLPKNAKASAVRARLEQLQFAEAFNGGDAARLELFMLLYPRSAKYQDAAKAAEDLAWPAVAEINSPYAYNAFAEQYPHSAHAGEAAEKGKSVSLPAAAQEALRKVFEEQPEMRYWAAACDMSRRARTLPEGPTLDELRRRIEQCYLGTADTCGRLPEYDEPFNAAAKLFMDLTDRQKTFSERLKDMEKTAQLAKAAASAAEKLSKKIEMDELESGVLGSKSSTLLEEGDEKSSALAARAQDRLKQIAEEADENLRRLKKPADDEYRAVQYYLRAALCPDAAAVAR